MVEFVLTTFLTRSLFRIIGTACAFGLVYLIDRLTQQPNDWSLKYVFTIILLANIFMAILDMVVGM
jgi:hypothetical protein